MKTTHDKCERPELCSFHEDFYNISNQYATHITNKILSEDMELTTFIEFKNISTILHNLPAETYVPNKEHTFRDISRHHMHEPCYTHKNPASTRGMNFGPNWVWNKRMHMTNMSIWKLLLVLIVLLALLLLNPHYIVFYTLTHP